jgi:hypothetical protein
VARRFDCRRVKLHRSYTIAELSTLIGAHKHTIGRWIAAGLKTTDARRPLLIHGADFRAFVKSREPIKQRCQPGEFYCLGCRAPRRPALNMADFRPLTVRQGLMSGICPCGRMIYRAATLAKLDAVKGGLEVAFPSGQQRIGDLFLITTSRQITSRGLEESATQLIPKFATVVVARGATTGRLCMFGREMAMNQTCYALASRNGRHFWLNCSFLNLIDHLVHAGHGSVFNTITTATLSAGRVVVPGPRVLDHFELTVAPMFESLLASLQEAHVLACLRDALLPKLISGELRIADAVQQVSAA